MVKTINDDKVFVYSAQSSYYVLMSTVPFIMIATMLVGTVFPMSSDDIAAILTDLLPGMFKTFAQNALEQIFSSAKAFTFSLTTVFLLFAASAGIRSLGDGIQYVYNKDIRIPFHKDILRSFATTLLFVLTILFAVVILLLGDPIKTVLDYLGFDNNASFFFVVINYKNLIFVLMLTVIFMTAYKGLAKSDIPAFGHFFGALIAAGGWVVFSFGFNIYIENFSAYPSLYGGFAIIIVFMIWLNMCMVILLLGAEINKMLYNRKHKK